MRMETMKTIKKILLISKRAKVFFLTFDVEDFINDKSISAIYAILELLKKYKLKGLFFITGHMIEKLRCFSEILDLLNTHEIGYHSSSHSIRPNIFEYNDVKNYEEAYLESYERETSHVNVLTGEIKGKGGIELLRDVFPKKKIEAYRAPGFCWVPSHLEAMKKMGIKYDFSTTISSTPIYYKGITFYPPPIAADFPVQGNDTIFRTLLESFLKRRVTVMDWHPNFFTNRESWDRFFFKSNPRKLLKAHSRSKKEMRYLFRKLELVLKRIKHLKTLNLLKVTPDLKTSKVNLDVSNLDIDKIYEDGIHWSRAFFHYKPKYLRSHFYNYFNVKIKEDPR